MLDALTRRTQRAPEQIDAERPMPKSSGRCGNCCARWSAARPEHGRRLACRKPRFFQVSRCHASTTPGFPVSDFARSKAVLDTRALAPLGYGLMMEVPSRRTSGSGSRLRRERQAGFLDRRRRRASAADPRRDRGQDRATVDAFHRAALAAGGKDNGAPGLRPPTIRLLRAPSCSIRTATTSKRCVTRRMSAWH